MKRLVNQSSSLNCRLGVLLTGSAKPFCFSTQQFVCLNQKVLLKSFSIPHFQHSNCWAFARGCLYVSFARPVSFLDHLTFSEVIQTHAPTILACFPLRSAHLLLIVTTRSIFLFPVRGLLVLTHTQVLFLQYLLSLSIFCSIAHFNW